MPQRRGGTRAAAKARPPQTLKSYFSTTKGSRAGESAAKRLKRDDFPAAALHLPQKALSPPPQLSFPKQPVEEPKPASEQTSKSEAVQERRAPEPALSPIESPAKTDEAPARSPQLRRKVRPGQESLLRSPSAKPLTPSSVRRRLPFAVDGEQTGEATKPSSLPAPIDLPPLTPALAKGIAASKAVRSMKSYKAEMAKSSPVFQRLAEKMAEKAAEAEAKAEAKAEEAKTASKSAGKAKLLMPSPAKSPTKAPAHERLGLLAEREPGLGIPEPQRLLYDFFQHADRFVFHLSQRHEAATFPKLQTTVQTITHRDFRRSHLAQIRTVFPKAFHYRLEAGVSRFGQRSRPSAQVLIVSPNTTDDLEGFEAAPPPGTPAKTHAPAPQPNATPSKTAPLLRQPSPSKSPGKTPSKTPFESPVKPGEGSPSKRPKGELAELNPGRLLKRRGIFRARLMELLKEAHRSFLRTLEPPVELSAEEDARLRRWDPRFLSTAWEVPGTELPRAAAVPDAPLSGAEFLARAETSSVVPGRVRRAAEAAEAARGPVELGPSPRKGAAKALAGLSESLVAEIKAKEAASARKTLVLSAEEAAEVAALERLLRYVPTLRAMVVQAKPGATSASLEGSVVAGRLGRCHVLSPAQCHADLLRLARLCPDFLTHTPLGQRHFFKFRLAVPLKDVLKTIQDKLD